MEARHILELQNSLPDEFNQRVSLRDEDHAGTIEQKLKTLLLRKPFTYKEAYLLYMRTNGYDDQQTARVFGWDDLTTSGLYKWDDLKSMVDATDEQLEYALQSLSAVEINEYWRIVDDGYMNQMLATLASISQGYGWSFSSLDGDKVVNSLVDVGFLPVIVRRCLELYASTTDGRFWNLDTERVGVVLGLWILKSKGMIELKNFMLAWTVTVKCPVTLDMLQDKIVLENHGNQTWVYLSSDPHVSRELHSAFCKHCAR